MTITEKYAALSDEYKARLMRYADELLILSRLPASDPDLDSVQTSTPDPEREEILRCGEKMEKIAHKADVPLKYQMNLREMQYLFLLMKRDGDPFNALCFAFDYGFVNGNRATRSGKAKAL